MDTIDLDNPERGHNSKIQKNNWDVMDFEYLFTLFLIWFFDSKLYNLVFNEGYL